MKVFDLTAPEILKVKLQIAFFPVVLTLLYYECPIISRVDGCAIITRFQKTRLRGIFHGKNSEKNKRDFEIIIQLLAKLVTVSK